MKYKSRIEKVRSMLKNSIMVIPSANLKTRSNDTEFKFRQNSDFFYLTGFREDRSILVIDTKKTILFVEKKDPMLELWNGKRTGKEKALETLQIDEAHDIQDFDTIFSELAVGHDVIQLPIFEDQDFFNKIFKLTSGVQNKARRGSVVPSSFKDSKLAIGKLRLMKDSFEVTDMENAAKITEQMFKAAFSLTAPKKNENDILSYMEFISSKLKGYAPAYGIIVASGDNANCLHYVSNDCELKDGDLLLIDAGSEFNHYASDVTRTFPINGKFSKSQKEVYEVVLDTMKECFEKIRPGLLLSELNKFSHERIAKGLLDLGILSGDLEKLINENSVQKYYPHGVGHYLGLDVHDQCMYFDKGKEIPLAKGMVITVEPGVYLPLEDDSIPKEYRGIGIRIEDDILITENGFKNLTESIPKEVSDVEEACKANFDLNSFN